jgi:hypothetical protein
MKFLAYAALAVCLFSVSAIAQGVAPKADTVGKAEKTHSSKDERAFKDESEKHRFKDDAESHAVCKTVHVKGHFGIVRKHVRCS